MTNRDLRANRYIARASDNAAVRRDLHQMYANSTSGRTVLDADIMANARSQSHAQAVSRALQWIELQAGGDKDFDGMWRVDALQEEYEGRVMWTNANFESQDDDGYQYYRYRESAVGDRFAKHMASYNPQLVEQLAKWVLPSEGASAQKQTDGTPMNDTEGTKSPPSTANGPSASEPTPAAGAGAVLEAELEAGDGPRRNFFVVNEADVFAGATENYTGRDQRGRVVGEGMRHEGVGVAYRGSVAQHEGELGDAESFGARNRAALEANAYAGAESAVERNELGEVVAAQAKAGAYVGVDATYQQGLGFRYFGIGAKASVGVGAGAQGEAHVSNKDGRVSIGAAAKGGKGLTVGGGVDAWIDYGQIGRDLKSAGKWISGLFSGIDWKRG